MFLLSDDQSFPRPEEADKNGLLAVGGDLSPKRVLLAYQQGIFPWYDSEQPVLWWCPDPRFVLFPKKLRVSKSMSRLFKKNEFSATYNQCFEKVIKECASIERKGQGGTWITSEMQQTYIALHRMKLAHSVEVWQNKELVGGLYGIYLKENRVFCGESMFSKKSNASKYGFISLVKKLKNEGVKIIDCQIPTDHLKSLGAEEISRKKFLRFLGI